MKKSTRHEVVLPTFLEAKRKIDNYFQVLKCRGKYDYPDIDDAPTAMDSFIYENDPKGKAKSKLFFEMLRDAVQEDRYFCIEECAKVAKKSCPDCKDIKRYGSYRCVACEIATAIRNRSE